ncbi:hypothetical protein [Thalassovita aquimarina]|uniref:Uncharacterized protein n=1 Tax=Thalassovita aquimarina TaxID=2785917 RepID=A0ABS5HML0_9RHOB|nr:hypothetical protein [Thalassovita aquimarina]MBR9650181.1 hypothetical protein [Thalassovita aquimarina]
MLGLIFILGSLICSGIWVFMLVSGNKEASVFGKSFETYMFLSVGFAGVATILLRIGI